MIKVRNAAIALLAAVMIASQVFAGALPKPRSKNPEAQKLIDQAWALELVDSNAKIFKDCIALMEKADKLDPNNPEILIDLSRYWWSYGDNLPKQTKEQQRALEAYYSKGMAYAEKSLAIKESVAAHYWWAVNKAAGLEFSGIASQAAGFPSIKKHVDYVTGHEPDYYYGGSGRIWSEIQSRVPKILVKIVGWNVQDTIDQINNGIKLEPRYFDNYVYKARFYYVYFDDKNEALKALDVILKQDPNVLPSELTANKVSQRDGRELWKQITGKDYPNK